MLNVRRAKLKEAIKLNGNYCSKCDFTWIPFSEYTEVFCPCCEKDKIKSAKEFTAKTLAFIENMENDHDIYDTLDDDFTLNIPSKKWLEAE